MKKENILVVLSIVGVLGLVTPAFHSDAAWKSNSNGRYYTADNEKGYVTGFKKIGKYTYYFNSNKYAAKGWKRIKRDWYFFDAKGRMLTDIWVDGFYLTASGKMAKNTVVDGITVDGNGNRIVMPDTGSGTENETDDVQSLKNTWIQKDGKWYYYTYKGILAKGFLTIKNATYYMDPATGERLTGLLRINKKYYYFDPQTGIQKTGYIIDNGKAYYFSKRTKAALKGWNRISRKYYYFNSKGVLQRNCWIGKKYYVDQSGRRVYGWVTIGSYKYYTNPQSGIKMKGRIKIGANTYYFNSAGRMLKNKWVKGRYYQSSGKMAKNKWVKNKYVNSSGTVSKTRSSGFYTENGKTYYMKSDYTTAKNGWACISKKWYYFDKDGVLLKSAWQDGFYVNDKGERVVNQFLTIPSGNNAPDSTYFFQEDGTPAKGLIEYNGNKYYFSSTTGIMNTGFYLINGQNYYFEPKTGAMVVDKVMIINDAVYSFDANGVATLRAENANKGIAIAEYAKKFVGYPYVYGGDTDLTKGVDCSGFTMLVYKYFGLNIPRVAAAQAKGSSNYGGPFAEAKFISEKELLPGDIICYYSPVSHVGIYIGNGKIVHASNSAPYPQGGIKISNYNYTTITKIVRYW